MTKVLNDLFDYGLKIYQDDEVFKFSLDSILLAEFVNVKLRDKNILDLCTGNAPIPLILSTKTKAKIDGMEIQKYIYDLGVLSVKENNCEKQIKLINDDIKNHTKYFPGNIFDIITCNPPYFKCNETSLLNSSMSKAIARHEIKINLCDIIKIVNKLLKENGYFYISYRVERLEELIDLLKENNLQIKRIQFVYSNQKSESELVLLETVKNGKQGLKVMPPIFINEYKSYQSIFEE